MAKKKEAGMPAAREARKGPRSLVTIDSPDDVAFEGNKAGKGKEAGRERTTKPGKK